ncbi:MULTISPECIES: response regulator transcription factor [Bacillaceae]|uniref:response regulator transcription factor n=1 Tax=Bacillaceae TaxID=186817 RepID=UPI001E4150FA|nr:MULTISPECIES: response regulator transcription factor [Bacillaceae]MCE4049353.1 response regulator transcription factor [Bacillus sp. Au-Bac7]UPO90229.1 response regulator transcription factor [Niallia sp. Man26]
MFKVLLADDEPIITKGLSAILDWEDYGFEIVHTAESGEEALSYIKENPIDILISDILMGEMSGLDLIQEVKSIRSDTKSIVLTGYQEFDYIKRGLLLGIENYLVKPVDEEELLKTLQSVGQKLKVATAGSQTKDSTTMLDNTLWGFLTGEVSQHDCLERLALYNIEFNKPFYNVSILNIEHFQQSEVVNHIRHYIETKYSALCLHNPNQEIIIIFDGSSEEELIKQNQRLVTDLCNEQKRIGLFYLAMGKPVQMLDELNESFTMARDCSAMQLYLEPNVLITDKQALDRHDEQKQQQEFKDCLVKMLMNAEEESLALVDLFFKNLTEKDNLISPQVAKKYTFDLISYIHYSVRPDDLCLYTAVVERIVYSSDIEQMRDILTEYCYELILTVHNHVHLRSPIVQNVLTFIHAHFDQGLSLKTLGQQFHVNAIYLGQLFQKEVGVVFSEYLNRYRLEKAKELLKATHYRAGDIGKKVGYSDTTYFYKQFKKMVGTTPSEWRKI